MRILALLRTLRADLTPALLSTTLPQFFHFTCEGGRKGGEGWGERREEKEVDPRSVAGSRGFFVYSSSCE